MRVARLTCALITALALAGCGSATNADAPADGGLTGAPIRIGQIAPTGTSIYNAPDSIAVAKAAVRGVNARGGIGGRPLELITCNDQVDPNKAAACARDLVSQDVVATVRVITTAGGDAVSSILGAAGIPDIGRGALTPSEFAAPGAYLLDGGVVFAYAAVLQRFAAEGKKRVYLAITDAASSDPTIATLTRTAATLGLTVVGTTKLPTATADYAPFVAAIGQSGAEGVVLAFPQQPIVQTVKAADQSGLEVDWLLNGGGLTPSDLASLPEEQTQRMSIGTGTMPLSAAGTNDVATRMRSDIDAEFAAGNTDADPTKLFGNALIAYAAVAALPQLLQGVGTIDAESVTAALARAKDIPLGITPPWTPSASGPAGFVRVSNPYIYISTVQNNELTLEQPEPVDVRALLR